ncbi:MAG: DUF2240 family protein [Halobacteriales archaeon]|nr:DUF2240 family protein [Halobacteriales archaeon]
MASELEAALAFVARREGRRAMAAARWAHVISFDLGWMAPAQAKAFVARGVEAALLRPDGESLAFALDPAASRSSRPARAASHSTAAIADSEPPMRACTAATCSRTA